MACWRTFKGASKREYSFPQLNDSSCSPVMQRSVQVFLSVPTSLERGPKAQYELRQMRIRRGTVLDQGRVPDSGEDHAMMPLLTDTLHPRSDLPQSAAAAAASGRPNGN